MNDLVTRNGMLAITAAAIVSACGSSSSPSPTSSPTNTLGFFVTSATSLTGNLGGLRGADALCQSLATAVGAGSKTWRAYRHRTMGQRSGRRGGGERQRTARAPRRRVGVRRRTRAADQRSVDRIARARPARHPHGIVRRRLADGRTHLQRLDLVVLQRRRSSGTFRRVRSQSGHLGHAVVVELSACERQLR